MCVCVEFNIGDAAADFFFTAPSLIMGNSSSSQPPATSSGNPGAVKFSTVPTPTSPVNHSSSPPPPVKPSNHPNFGMGLRWMCPVKEVREGSPSPPPPTPAPPATPPAAAPTCPVKKTSSSTTYNVYSQPIDPKNNMPVHANNLPSFNQDEKLSQHRVPSTIPKGGDAGGSTWTYPSPQMFWNSINRKAKVGDTSESDVTAVVAIHNNMNEKTWKKVLQWESVMGEGAPKLLKFMGRPTDLSPKAWARTLVGYPLPFDRHDWTVERGDGTQVRYVIDYYHDDSAKESAELPAMDDEHAVKSILVDVRPALDSPAVAAAIAVLMPLAMFNKTTDYSPLPFMPTEELRAQQGEAKITWNNIVSRHTPGSEKGKLGEGEIDALNKELKTIRDSCFKQQTLVDKCSGDAECAQASLALTMCMAKFVCPLQHGAVVTVLGRETDVDDGKLDVSLENMVNCIGLWDEKMKQKVEQEGEKKN